MTAMYLRKSRAVDDQSTAEALAKHRAASVRGLYR